MNADDLDDIRQLLTRYVLVLSAAEGLAVGMMETLQKVQQGMRPDTSPDRLAHLGDTLGMVQAWSRDADGLWKALGLERRQAPAAGVDPNSDRRKPPASRSVTI